MNKPLSKLRRAEIERDLADQHVSYNDFAGEAIRDLLASESFWREAVKNANHAYGRGVWDAPVCNFCNAELSDDGGCEETCAYMIAQES